MTKMAKIDTLFITKTAEKLYPVGPHKPVPCKDVRANFLRILVAHANQFTLRGVIK